MWGKPLVAAAPPVFDAEPEQASCVAMSADGAAAAFRVWKAVRDKSEPGEANRIKWFGPGKAPAADLACLARKCTPEQAAAVTQAASAAGLVGCAVAKGAVALDGMLVPFMYKERALRLQGGSGWRTVLELTEISGV